MLTLAGCRTRQKRLLTAMERNGCDTFLSANYRTIYYLTGCLNSAETPTIFLLNRNTGSVLVTSVEGDSAADEILPVETYSITRTITHPWADSAALLKNFLARRPSLKFGRTGIEAGTFPMVIQNAVETVFPNVIWADVTEVLLALRKFKEADEISEIRDSLRYCAVAYRAAREIIAPGRTELDVYNAMFSAIVREAGTTISFPGDFACGLRGIRGGGPPTRRPIEAGDLYILDLFPAPALYFGDTCRTFAVGPPSDLQFRAWELVLKALHLAEAMVKPGVRARDVYQTVKDFLDSHDITQKSFWHHAGHGIGYHGHEAPRIIPGSNDVFEVGDVITIEPGVYSERMQGGIRLEDNYVVRENGLENLFDFPMDL